MLNLTLRARVVGIYRADQTDDPYWYGDLLPVEGEDRGSRSSSSGRS
ncbi:MAG: hypothetical protein R2849_15960 [Thermomicrobiales bacterium]